MTNNAPLILVVDNEKDVVDLVKLGLDIEGLKCVEAYSGRKALEILRSNNNIELVLLDIMMEDMDGYETLQEIRKEKKFDNIPIIMLTAKPEDKNLEITFSVGADDYISKPFTFEVLLARITKLLKQRRKKLQDENRFSEIEKVKNTFELILDNAGFGLMLVSKKKDILLINKYLKNLTGISDSNFEAADYRAFNDKHNLPAIKSLQDSERKDLAIEKNNYTHSLVSPKNEKFFFYIEEYPVFSAAGEIIGIVQVYIDITEYKKMESLMIHSEKLTSVGQLAASLAHEINNPLTLLSGILQIFNASSDLPKKFQPDVQLMFDITERIKNLIEKMLVLSGKHDLAENVEKLNVCQLIDESLRLVDYKLKSSKITINKKYENNNNYFVSASKWSIIHCFVNLLINAIDASEQKHGIIDIDIFKENNFIIIQFRDYGKGILEKDISSLFTPFFTTKQAGKGTGLGLYIVKHILSTYNARVEIKNAEDNAGGVEAALYFPISE